MSTELSGTTLVTFGTGPAFSVLDFWQGAKTFGPSAIGMSAFV